ncbi:sensor histidine kinase [Falsirhodobacter sp. 1013]|uniref:sensor histidine kinase n=1 Tax=Falsirhodobacter sp. 1013 TaxID=3417566 RepID=UPI003EBDA916
MKPPRPQGRALWVTLALWMLPTLLLLMMASLLLTAQSLREVADSAYDRSLNGAIRAIDLNISTQSGGLSVELPYPLFESFQATASGEVLFRISTDDGLVQIGDALLPPPPALQAGDIKFYDATYFGRAIRVGAFKRPLDPPLYGAKAGQSLIVEVAETTGSRVAFLRTVLFRAALRDIAALMAAALMISVGVHAALRPLRALRDRLDRRASDDLRQVDPTGLPRDVQPLVRSVNRLVERHRLQSEAQRRFIDDASHQLKTPLSVLGAQIDLASRLDDLGKVREVLAAMRGITGRSARLTSQLLTLAHARNATTWADQKTEAAPVPELLDEVVRLHLAAARRRRILLEIEAEPDLPILHLSEALLFEAISNLLDNAITASPERGSIILAAARAGDQVRIEVRDQGPGLSDRLRERFESGQRFGMATRRRVADGGTGLGLSIVQEIARAFRGELRLTNRAEGGLSAILCIPAVPAKADS